MPYKKPTWKEKLEDNKDFPKVEPIPSRMSKNWGTGTLVIPAPKEVDQLMRKVPYGKLTTINDVRAALAKKHKATIGCPMTTGIFASIAAHAAEEERQQGKSAFTPYWRTLRTGGLINEKYPGGLDLQKLFLESEGHVVLQKGKKYFVKDYLKALVPLD